VDGGGRWKRPRGRSGIYELIVVEDQMRTMIHDGASEQEMEEICPATPPRPFETMVARRLLRGEQRLRKCEGERGED